MFDCFFCQMFFELLSRKGVELMYNFFLILWPKYRSSRSQLFYKLYVLQSFSKLTGKQLCCSLFLINLQVCIKKRHHHRCFPLIFTIFLRTTFFVKHVQVTDSEDNSKIGYFWVRNNTIRWILFLVNNWENN